MASRAKDRCDILLVGRSGSGKSTTGNKLLGVSDTMLDKAETLVLHFVIGNGEKPETKECKFLFNHKAGVLDTPGFADFDMAEEHGVMKSNLQIFRWILRAQEHYNLAFRRVLYFLPQRGPLERADGTLQEEIKVMYEFLGEEIFNIMVLIATQPKGEKYQVGFDVGEISRIKRVFTVAYQRATSEQLQESPPVLYIPCAASEEELLEEVKEIEVIDDRPIEKPAVIDVTKEEEFHIAIGNNPGKRLHFRNTCIRCAGKILVETSPSGQTATMIRYENKKGKVVERSKCHPIFIPKHYTVTKIIGGIAHIAMLGIPAAIGYATGSQTWPGFTNSDEYCPVCGLSPGSDGCSVVGEEVEIQGKGSIKTSHSRTFDEIVEENQN